MCREDRLSKVPAVIGKEAASIQVGWERGCLVNLRDLDNVLVLSGLRCDDRRGLVFVLTHHVTEWHSVMLVSCEIVYVQQEREH